MDQSKKTPPAPAAFLTDRNSGRKYPVPPGLDMMDPAPFAPPSTSASFTHLQLASMDISEPLLQEFLAKPPICQHPEPTAVDELLEDMAYQLEQKQEHALAYILQEHYGLDPLEVVTRRRLHRVALSHQPHATHFMLDYKSPEDPGQWICTIRLAMGLVEQKNPADPHQLKAQLKVVAPILLPDDLPRYKFPDNARP